MITLYGIAHCDSVKKARAWLTEEGHDHHFHDFKKHGAPATQLAAWSDAVGWEALLNRRGTTWRQLDAATQATVVDARSALAVLAAHSSAIKRPVIVWNSGATTVGVDEAAWRQAAQIS